MFFPKLPQTSSSGPSVGLCSPWCRGASLGPQAPRSPTLSPVCHGEVVTFPLGQVSTVSFWHSLTWAANRAESVTCDDTIRQGAAPAGRRFPRKTLGGASAPGLPASRGGGGGAAPDLVVGAGVCGPKQESLHLDPRVSASDSQGGNRGPLGWAAEKRCRPAPALGQGVCLCFLQQ